MTVVKMYNRTTSPIVFNTSGGSFTLAASNAPGVDGPEFNLMQNVAAVMVLSEASKQVNELLEAGSIRISPAVPV